MGRRNINIRRYTQNATFIIYKSEYKQGVKFQEVEEVKRNIYCSIMNNRTIDISSNVRVMDSTISMITRRPSKEIDISKTKIIVQDKQYSIVSIDYNLFNLEEVKFILHYEKPYKIARDDSAGLESALEFALYG